MSKSNTSRREALRAQQLAAQKAARTRKMVFLGAGLVALVLVAVLAVVLVQNVGRGGGSSAFAPTHANDTRDAVVLAGANAKPGAPTVEVYVDFQCPLCKIAERDYLPTLLTMADAGEVKVVQRTMTFMDGNLSNTASTRAALAATCADVHGDRYKQMTTAIFAQQAEKEVLGSVGYSDELLRTTLPTQVGIAGADLTAYQACYDAQQPKAFLDAVQKASYTAGVNGTPTFLRNGVQMRVQVADDPRTGTKATPLDTFRSMIANGS